MSKRAKDISKRSETERNEQSAEFRATFVIRFRRFQQSISCKNFDGFSAQIHQDLKVKLMLNVLPIELSLVLMRQAGALKMQETQTREKKSSIHAEEREKLIESKTLR